MTFAAICCLSLACALLSVIVVARRWAFIGEGISHAAFGGAGTAWILFLLFPALNTPWVFQASIVVFCWITAALIAGFSRSQRSSADSVIGIFMVASLAWGFIANEIYVQVKHHPPLELQEALIGDFSAVPATYAMVTIIISLAIIGLLFLFGKEIVAYCVDPVLAQVSGVAAGFIHYLLLMILALVITLGVRLIGALLFTALLVLPGATANLLTKQLKSITLISCIAAMIGALGGMAIQWHWRFLREGPCIVLVLFILFLGAFLTQRSEARG